MAKRTTIEIDEELLDGAKTALGEKTTRGAVEEALRRASANAAAERRRRAAAQRAYLDGLGRRADPPLTEGGDGAAEETVPWHAACNTSSAGPADGRRMT